MLIRFRPTLLGIAALVPVMAFAAEPVAQTPIPGHYPPGQSGIRGGSAPPPGWAYTNFSRFFSNIEVVGPGGDIGQSIDEFRFANISMFTWITNRRVLGMSYGMQAGVPFSTGNLNPSSAEVNSSDFGLGDILLTPVALYSRGTSHDAAVQFTVWSASGRFEPGSTGNRGAGFWSFVYSLGGTWYPAANRQNWSFSGIARLEQNFMQTDTGITPGDDLVIDWGIGKVMKGGVHPIEVGVSGFATWQLTKQSGVAPGTDVSLYRYYGAGPEAACTPWTHLTLKVRAQWEFLARNAVRGNNLWFIIHYGL